MTTPTHITTSGGLISTAFIENVREPGPRQRGVEPASFALGSATLTTRPWTKAPQNPAALEETSATAQVIHYELPWNPNRLEQRNGRVDRFGQHKPVAYVRTMVMDETWRSGESNP